MKETDKIKNIAKDLLDSLGFDGKVSVDVKDEAANVDIVLSDSTVFLRSDEGALWAFQHILRVMAVRQIGERSLLILVDVNGFRRNKLRDLESDVQEAISEVQRSKTSATLPPMNSFERRTVHVLVSQYPDLTSESIGEGEERRVVIRLKA